MQPSNLVKQFLPAIRESPLDGQILDLACGGGRNGLYLAEHRQHVVFADRQQGKLDEVAANLPQNILADYWCVDFERPETDPLSSRLFSSILVFRYLHRPLMPAIKSAVQPGGLVIYETFTTDQAVLGRPRNPDFLLQPQELERVFQDWDILHRFEGLCVSELSGKQQAIAQIVARKPNR